VVEQRGTEPEGQGQPASGGASSSIPGWLLPVAALLAGLLLGGAAVALLQGDDDADPNRALSSPSPSTSSPEPRPTGSDVLIRAPGPCLEVADDAEIAVQALDEMAVAVRDFDARELQEILDRLQKLRPQVEAHAQQCREDTGRGLVEGDLVTPSPLPSPS